MNDLFEEKYKSLNPAQKEAVDSIEGPVMVIAGPGTGKTQVLALRIANILNKTDVGADGVLCLTFTNSGVFAMRDRLRAYINNTASKVEISTFHSFAMKMIEEFYTELGYIEKPELADEIASVALCDSILEDNHFEHLRSRSNKSMYFRDIKSLVSLLKREGMKPEDFLIEIEKEIKFLENDESSISSRGPSKGKLKADVSKKIESLDRTKEIVQFYELYEALKKEKNVLDYDDVLSELVRLVEVSDDAQASIRERYLYVLVDEHQDSSGIQNEFLSKVWGDIESPNIFVVGDDRQLIYGFGGASLSYFDGFKKTFAGVKLISLSDNYRSTQKILDTADSLLKSSLAEASLVSHHKENHALRIVEAEYPRDENIRAGLEIKEKIDKDGIDPNECAILVPKNFQVKNAMRILRDLGLPVAGRGTLKLFEILEAQSLLSILKALANPEAPHLIAPLLLDPLFEISPLVAHAFLTSVDTRKLSLSSLLKEAEDGSIQEFGEQMNAWLVSLKAGDIYTLIQKIGDELLVSKAKDHESLVARVEIVRSFLHLVLSQTERNPKMTLVGFLAFINRLEEYGSDIPLATFGSEEGVKVMTLHGSKGLEFDFVWIAHMDQKNISRHSAGGFTLPERVKEKVEKRDEEVIKRELYVAITRAKRFCTISCAILSYTGGSLELAHAVSDLDQQFFDKVSAQETEDFIQGKGISFFIKAGEENYDQVNLSKLADLVRNEYAKHKVSVTHLNNFFECPWKWYFRNLIQLPEPKSISLEFGNLIHGVLEKILKGKLNPNEKDILSAIDAELEKKQGFSDSDISRMKKDAENILLSWIKDRLPNIAEVHESEKSLQYRDPDFDHLVITGKIDLIESLEDNSVRVTDFKTGTVKKKNEIEKESEDNRLSIYRRQLAMYSYLLDRTTSGNIRVVESCLEFIEAKADSKDSIYKTEITAEDIAKLRQDISDFDQLLISGEWTARECDFKPFKPGDVCEYCGLAQIYKNRI